MPRGGHRPNAGRKEKPIKRISQGLKVTHEEWELVGHKALLHGFKTLTGRAKRWEYIMMLVRNDKEGEGNEKF
jgi:hypothetical protein